VECVLKFVEVVPATSTTAERSCSILVVLRLILGQQCYNFPRDTQLCHVASCAILQCYDVTTAQERLNHIALIHVLFYNVTIVRCYNVTMAQERLNHVALIYVQCNNVTMM